MPGGRSFVLFRVTARGVARRALQQFSRLLEAKIAGGRHFCCVITGDGELQRLNLRFRKKDTPTDVLSFPSSIDAPGNSPGRLLGEIAISFDRAKEQAKALGHSAEQEMQILMLHGVLHLAGMDHERDCGEMARAEQHWRKHFGLPAGLIERAQ